jgi:hypothetical protein
MLLPLAGGDWLNGAPAGVFEVNLNNNSDNNNNNNNGARAVRLQPNHAQCRPLRGPAVTG